MRVIFTKDALADLRAVGRWIAQNNPERARSFSGELREACLSLGRQSKRFPVARTVDGSEVRKRVHRRYLILYRVASEVEILHVIHGSRDWAALLGEAE